MEQLAGFYHPYVAIPNETLKLTALYFDEVRFVVAKGIFDRYPDSIEELRARADTFPPNERPTYLRRITQLDSFLRTTRPLCEAEVLQPLKIGGLDLIAAGVPSLRNAAEPLQRILRQEVDPYGTFIALRQRAPSNDAWDNMLSSYPWLIWAGTPPNVVPFTDEPGCHRAFSALVTGRRDPRELAATLAMQSIRLAVPYIGLRALEEVLEARQKLAEELHLFRSHMLQLTNDVRMEPWTSSFGSHVRAKAKEIEGFLRNMERKIRLSRDRFFVSIGATTSVGVVALLAQAYEGSLLSCATTALGTIAAQLTLAYNERSTEKEVIGDNRELSFLLTLRRRLGGTL